MQLIHADSRLHHEDPTLKLLRSRAKHAYFYETEFGVADAAQPQNLHQIRKNKTAPKPPVRTSVLSTVPQTSTKCANSQQATDRKDPSKQPKHSASVNKDSCALNKAKVNYSDRIPATTTSSTSNAYMEYPNTNRQRRSRKARRHTSVGISNSKSESNLHSSSGDGTMKCTNSTTLSEKDTFQIQLFYSAKGTHVIVCSCLCNLYFGKESRGQYRNYGHNAKPTSETWNLMATGVPVLLLDEGGSRSRPERRVQLILAERGTGYTLWSDVIDALTNYTELGTSFHTMLFSNDHHKVAGLRFDNSYAAAQFLQHVRHLAAEPENVALSNPNRDSKRMRRHSIIGSQLTNKMSISTPCCFRHVTSLKPHQIAALDPDNNKLSAFKTPLNSTSALSTRAQSCFTISNSSDKRGHNNSSDSSNEYDDTKSQGSPNTVV